MLPANQLHCRLPVDPPRAGKLPVGHPPTIPGHVLGRILGHDPARYMTTPSRTKPVFTWSATRCAVLAETTRRRSGPGGRRSRRGACGRECGLAAGRQRPHGSRCPSPPCRSEFALDAQEPGGEGGQRLLERLCGRGEGIGAVAAPVPPERHGRRHLIRRTTSRNSASAASPRRLKLLGRQVFEQVREHRLLRRMVTMAEDGATRSPDGTTSGAATVAADSANLADLARLLAFAGSTAFTTAGTSSAAACRLRGGGQ